jgi:hypothetical protein
MVPAMVDRWPLVTKKRIYMYRGTEEAVGLMPWAKAGWNECAW